MNKVNCDIVTPEFRTLLVGLDKWRNSSKANKIFNDPSEAALKLAKTNFSIDRYDPRITYKVNNIVFCCVDCNEKKKNSNPDDWLNFIRIGKELYKT